MVLKSCDSFLFMALNILKRGKIKPNTEKAFARIKDTGSQREILQITMQATGELMKSPAIIRKKKILSVLLNRMLIREEQLAHIGKPKKGDPELERLEDAFSSHFSLIDGLKFKRAYKKALQKLDQ